MPIVPVMPLPSAVPAVIGPADPYGADKRWRWNRLINQGWRRRIINQRGRRIRRRRWWRRWRAVNHLAGASAEGDNGEKSQEEKTHRHVTSDDRLTEKLQLSRLRNRNKITSSGSP
jgi:siroheme synthase (precorrin-2 oxidase/ferrochelatase)